jgi:hypothetical protein
MATLTPGGVADPDVISIPQKKQMVQDVADIKKILATKNPGEIQQALNAGGIVVQSVKEGGSFVKEKKKRNASEKQRKSLARARAIKAVKREMRIAEQQRVPMNRVDPYSIHNVGAGGKFDNMGEFNIALTQGHPATRERDLRTRYVDDVDHNAINYRDASRRTTFYF